MVPNTWFKMYENKKNQDIPTTHYFTQSKILVNLHMESFKRGPLDFNYPFEQEKKKEIVKINEHFSEFKKKKTVSNEKSSNS